MAKSKLCQSCHEGLDAEYIHGPVLKGSCMFCHEHHKSRHEHLLKELPVAGLCGRCHTEDTFATIDRHAPHSDRDCTDCHDPHSSNYRYLLRAPHKGPGLLLETGPEPGEKKK